MLTQVTPEAGTRHAETLRFQLPEPRPGIEVEAVRHLECPPWVITNGMDGRATTRT